MKKEKMLLLCKEQQQELIKTLIKYEEIYKSEELENRDVFPLSPFQLPSRKPNDVEIVGNKFSSHHFAPWNSHQLSPASRSQKESISLCLHVKGN